MGISRHKLILMLLRKALKALKKTLYRLCDPAKLVAEKQFEIYQHLIIARATGVYFLPHIA